MTTMKSVSHGKKRRILLVDDHAIVREGLTRMINEEPDLMVCGQAEDENEAVKEVEKTRPDLVLVDLSLKNRNGIELIKVLKASHPELLMLVLSMHEESLYAERALRAGARGYIMKQEPAEKLLQFIRRILAGEVCISERATERVLKGLAGAHANAEESRLHELSDRELEVFQLMGQGLATREVAQRLSLSIKTIESHCESLKRKLNAPTTEDLRRMAAQRAQNPQTPDSSAKLRSPEAGI